MPLTMMKLLLTVLIGVLFTFSAFAQGDWTDFYKDQIATIQYRYMDCHRPEDGIHRQEILLRFANLTQKAVTITYHKQISYNNNPANQPSAENTFTVTLKPGEVLEGSCGLKDKRLYIFVKMLDGTSQSVLTAFDLVNIKVTQN
ncbi:hypothetical protein BH09BAC1_BH09BAC1_30650 [soil metagenome]